MPSIGRASHMQEAAEAKGASQSAPATGKGHRHRDRLPPSPGMVRVVTGHGRAWRQSCSVATSLPTPLHYSPPKDMGQLPFSRVSSQSRQKSWADPGVFRGFCVGRDECGSHKFRLRAGHSGERRPGAQQAPLTKNPWGISACPACPSHRRRPTGTSPFRGPFSALLSGSRRPSRFCWP